MQRRELHVHTVWPDNAPPFESAQGEGGIYYVHALSPVEWEESVGVESREGNDRSLAKFAKLGKKK